MRNRKTNASLQFHMFLRAIIFLGFSLLIVKFVVNDTIQLYIAPKMLPFVYFAGACFLIIGIFLFFKSLSPKLKEDMECNCGVDHQMKGSFITKTCIYLLFILPIVLGLGLPEKAVDSMVASNRGVQYGGGLYNKPGIAQTDSEYGGGEGANSVSEEEGTTEADADLDIMAIYGDQLKKYSAMNHIEITDENYLDVSYLINFFLDDFIGKTVSIKSFVYREPDFAEDQIIVARFAMNCCVADASVFGTIASGEQVGSLQDDTWIEVTGTIEELVYHDQRMASVRAEQVDEIEEPKNPYLTPLY